MMATGLSSMSVSLNPPVAAAVGGIINLPHHPPPPPPTIGPIGDTTLLNMLPITTTTSWSSASTSSFSPPMSTIFHGGGLGGTSRSRSSSSSSSSISSDTTTAASSPSLQKQQQEQNKEKPQVVKRRQLLLLPPNHAFVKLCLLWTALHRTNSLPPACHGLVSEDNLEELQKNEQANLGDILSRISDEDRGSKNIVLLGGKRPPPSPAHRDRLGLDNSNRMKYHYRYTTRSLSVIGVLGGIVLILLVVALSTCIRNRRNILLEHQTSGHETFARQILIDHIRHLSSSRRLNRTQEENSPPPSYDDVVKTEEEGEEEEEYGEDPELVLGDSTQPPPSYIEAMVLRRTSEVSLTPINFEEDEAEVVYDARAADSGRTVELTPTRPAATSPQKMSGIIGERSHIVQIEVPGVVHQNQRINNNSNKPSLSSAKSEEVSSPPPYIDGAKAAAASCVLK